MQGPTHTAGQTLAPEGEGMNFVPAADAQSVLSEGSRPWRPAAAQAMAAARCTPFSQTPLLCSPTKVTSFPVCNFCQLSRCHCIPGAWDLPPRAGGGAEGGSCLRSDALFWGH